MIMVKFSKKTAFFLMIIMSLLLVFSMRNVDWELIYKGESLYKELSISIVNLLLTIYFMVYYVNKLKEESKN